MSGMNLDMEGSPGTEPSIDGESAVDPTSVEGKPRNLPLELWVVTFDNLRLDETIPITKLVRTPASDIKSLKEVVQVSRTFRALAEPFLFERVKLNGNRFRHPRVRIHQLTEVLKNNPDRKRWIKYLTLEKWNFAVPPEECDKETDLVWKLFLDLKHLEALRLFHVSAYPQLFEHVGTLSKLRAFSTLAFQIKSDLPPGYPETPSDLQAVILRGVRGNPEHVTQAVVHPRLRRILHGSSYAPPILAQMSIFTFDQLREYHMVEPSIPNIKSFFRVASSMPGLLSLRIDSKRKNPPGEHEITPLHNTYLPILKELSGPLWLVVNLIPGRPIGKLTLRTLGASLTVEDQEKFKLLGSGSASVTSLHLEGSSWIHLELGNIADLFPDLEDLTIEIKERSCLTGIKAAGLPQIEFFHQLRALAYLQNLDVLGTFTITASEEADADEKQLLLAISEALASCPKTLTVRSNRYSVHEGCVSACSRKRSGSLGPRGATVAGFL